MPQHYTLPPENWMAKMAPFVMLMGIMMALAGFLFGVIASTGIDDKNPLDGQAMTAWVMPLTLTGIAFVLMAITIFLRGIFKGIRAMGTNVTHALNEGLEAGFRPRRQ